MRAGVFVFILLAFTAAYSGAGYAVDEGRELYSKACSACHGALGEGTYLAPALRDRAKLEGLGEAKIKEAVLYGRGVLPQYPKLYPKETYPGVMPAWQEMKQFSQAQMDAVVEYLVLSWMEEKTFSSTEEGKKIYADSCVFCHGSEGEGSELGPPINQKEKLDALGRVGVIAAITHGRGVFPEYPKVYPKSVYAGVMPAWGDKSQLSPEQADAVAEYILQQWGGISRIGIEMWPWEVAFVVFGAIWVIIGIYYVVTWW